MPFNSMDGAVEASTSVVSVLTRGMELANQLKKQLHSCSLQDAASPSLSLLDNILSSYHNALKLLLQSSPSNPTQWDTPLICNKKRKTGVKWSQQVRVNSTVGTGVEDDGYNWRKYGQKDILGSHYPRAYYRCTHRHTQGCLATKQVQRSDDDPSASIVVYKGKHSCIQHQTKQPVLIPEKYDEMMISKGLTVKAETDHQQLDHFPCFSLPSSPVGDDEYENMETKLFSQHSTIESPGFPSPATCTSQSFLSLLECSAHMSSELDFAEIISYPSSDTDVQQLQLADLDSLEPDIIDYFQ